MAILATLKKEILNIILRYMTADDCLVFLFGSHATGADLEGSDIDIGLLTRHELDPEIFLALEEELNNSLPVLKKIDLVDFGAVSHVVKKEAAKEIEIWHAGKNCAALLKNLKQASKG